VVLRSFDLDETELAVDSQRKKVLVIPIGGNFFHYQPKPLDRLDLFPDSVDPTVDPTFHASAFVGLL
jgi:hypothetical protein